MRNCGEAATSIFVEVSCVEIWVLFWVAPNSSERHRVVCYLSCDLAIVRHPACLACRKLPGWVWKYSQPPAAAAVTAALVRDLSSNNMMRHCCCCCTTCLLCVASACTAPPRSSGCCFVLSFSCHSRGFGARALAPPIERRGEFAFRGHPLSDWRSLAFECKAVQRTSHRPPKPCLRAAPSTAERVATWWYTTSRRWRRCPRRRT